MLPGIQQVQPLFDVGEANTLSLSIFYPSMEGWIEGVTNDEAQGTLLEIEMNVHECLLASLDGIVFKAVFDKGHQHQRRYVQL